MRPCSAEELDDTQELNDPLWRRDHRQDAGDNSEEPSSDIRPGLKNLGPALLVLRGMLQLSAGEAARRSGVGKSQLSKYETGKELPKLPSLQRVVEIYGLDLAGFFALVRVLDRISAKRSALLPSLELEVLGQFTTPAEEQALSELTAAVVRFFHAKFEARVQAALESSTRKARERRGADE